LIFFFISADCYRFAELTEPEMLLRLPEVGVVVVVVGVLMERRSASVYVVRVVQEETLYTFRPPFNHISVSLFAHLVTSYSTEKKFIILELNTDYQTVWQSQLCKSNYCILYAMLQTGCVK
jgi:hypothetical protein